MGETRLQAKLGEEIHSPLVQMSNLDYHDGRLYIGTGNTTGVYYLLGGAFADLVTRNVSGFEARAEPTKLADILDHVIDGTGPVAALVVRLDCAVLAGMRAAAR